MGRDRPRPPTKKDGYRPDKQGIASASISALFSERYGKASADGGADLPLHNSLSGGFSIIGTSYEIEDEAIVAAQKNVDTEERLARLRKLVGKLPPS